VRALPRFSRALVPASLILLLTACAHQARVSQSEPRPEPGPAQQVRIEHLPPTDKDLIHALIRSAEVPLTVDASCRFAGTERADRTIGRYISGFLAALDDPGTNNSIQTSLVDGPGGGDSSVWIARVMVGQNAGELVWQWGVEFHVSKRDGRVDAASFRCLGAG
jgi:hypothetical protein